MENATSFGTQADIYAAARPSYPDALFDWIEQHAPALEQVWDVGTGSGQAARSLAKRFKNVHATDIDSAQIKQALPAHNITYVSAPSDASGLADDSVDAITVATALHWFDFSTFWQEAARVGRKGALFCAWTYHAIEAQADIRGNLIMPIRDIIEPYWSDGNRLSWRGYPADEVGMPFSEIKTPVFTMELSWTPAQLIQFMNSWSAHKRAREDGHSANLKAIETQALARFDNTPRKLTLPIQTLAGRID
ncbi:MAG: class I SAM-dependent methyltransferase [Litorimonas sp.]